MFNPFEEEPAHTMTNVYAKINADRLAVVKENTNENVNYFKIQEYLELKYYSIYIFITPRSIGKTFSAWELIVNMYELTGEYSVWMRTSGEEVKEIVKDYKTNRPAPWREYMELRGNQLIDKRDGSLIVKFVSVSTLGNLASITGDGCFCIYYDEFLKRGKRRSQSGVYRAIGDFIKTVERGNLITIIMAANMTTLDNEILNKFDLWTDKPIVDDKGRRLRFRLITEWDNPPEVEEISTARMWAKNDEKLEAFMTKAQVLDNSKALVLPESRLGMLRNLEQYFIFGSYYTLSMTQENKAVIREGRHMKGNVWVMTTEDGYTPGNGHVRPYDLSLTVGKIAYYLEVSNLVFTSHKAKEDIIKYLISIQGKLVRKRG